MKVFEFDDYKKFVLARLRSMPKRGHGQFRRIAQLLNIHTTMVTHIFKGDAQLTIDHALKLGQHWGLDPLEKDYFIMLLQIERAGTSDARNYFVKQLAVLAEHARKISERLKESTNELSEL